MAADVTQNTVFTLDRIAFANENPGNFTGDVMRAAKTANPELVTSAFLGMGRSYNTTVEYLEKIDQTLANQFGPHSNERIAFHVMMGRGGDISIDDKGNPTFPAITEQGVAAFNTVLETSQGSYNGFDKAMAFEAAPAAEACEPKAVAAKNEGVFSKLVNREEYINAAVSDASRSEAVVPAGCPGGPGEARGR